MIEIILFLLLLLILYTVFFHIILIIICFLSGKTSYPLQKKPTGPCETWPTVSIFIPIHKNSDILTDKLIDISKSKYPDKLIEILVILDGDVAGIEEAIAKYRAKVAGGPELRIVSCPKAGKNIALSKGINEATGDIFLITDIDARLSPLAVRRLVGALGPEDVGGGCGRHLITSDQGAQNTYWDMEAKIKTAEMNVLGSVTAAYGTILAVKRHLSISIPPGVTDDHFLALSIVDRGFRFVYAPESIVYIEKPSRTLLMEIQRRRRIVAQSFYSLLAWKKLLNPINRGLYAICLASHKVLRRFLPLFLIAFFGMTLWWYLQGEKIAGVFLFLQASSYAIVFGSFVLGISGVRLPRPFRLAAYFFAGNTGIFLGIVDFLRGKKYIIW